MDGEVEGITRRGPAGDMSSMGPDIPLRTRQDGVPTTHQVVGGIVTLPAQAPGVPNGQTTSPGDPPTTPSSSTCLGLRFGLGHPVIKYNALWEEGKAALEQLLKFMVHPAISSINLTAALGSLATIARQRPMFMAEVIQAYETLHANLPPTLAKSQVSSVRKNLKLHLLSVLRHPSSGDFQPQITTLLVDLGTPQAEIARSMPSPREARKRPRDEPDAALKKMKIEPPLGEDDEDKDLEAPAVAVAKVAGAVTVPSDTDITAEFLQPLLTPENVANLVRRGHRPWGHFGDILGGGVTCVTCPADPRECPQPGQEGTVALGTLWGHLGEGVTCVTCPADPRECPQPGQEGTMALGTSWGGVSPVSPVLLTLGNVPNLVRRGQWPWGHLGEGVTCVTCPADPRECPQPGQEGTSALGTLWGHLGGGVTCVTCPADTQECPYL
ncbi:uncharacterized protein LOC135441334, partial [Zonotrichia leucophrys gambelii]|uniref:uncharacterized protein LOC135441334 n=1 Tax=Zonotrichia leucophrys gambelii TaxID=257770 RepID=UPI00314038D4